jgi:hypothetical protein
VENQVRIKYLVHTENVAVVPYSHSFECSYVTSRFSAKAIIQNVHRQVIKIGELQ